ncbi:MAG: 3-deoxy-D-manno-octulosonic acid transferase, partial [Bacteroidota bacterium]
MRLLYRIGVGAYHLALQLAALFSHQQARAWVAGRRNQLTSPPTQQPICWMHCASLGEWEQGRPVMN